MKIVQVIIAGVIVVGVGSSQIQANEPAKDINIHIGFGIGSEEGQVALDSAGMTTGKVMGATAFATVTGAAMAAALPLVKESEALTSLYVVVAGVLLYSQRETIKKVFGPAYTDFATWVSTVSMIGFGLGGMVFINKGLISAKVEPKEGENA